MAPDLLTPEAHVLVVEDDGEMRNLIAKFLRQNGYRATGARDGREMWETLANAAVDLILLDVMLPGQSGLDLTRALRAKTQVPIIMVTARGDETDRVLGLELGADDYIPKPFSRPELLARIRAVLRRAQGSDQRASGLVADRLLFAGWALDTRRRELMAPDGVAVDLSGGEYDLLLAFCEHPQRILSRDQLLDLARNRVSDALDRTVDVMVSRLRRKMEPTEESPTIIKTIRGAGYMFVPAVARG
ncbi:MULTISPECIES: response regulator [Roseomonas]|jgi:two-component system OmpR family response regulator|uniref:DNA-binding response regulator n=1 Tax=Roseomonas fluvialis TaxID=1750527 RepID=A0ABM7Y1F7_9PROT|nr:MULTISPECIES: response regulator transcription factor [Roseomonas]BDG71647.1 DNA-binding response regulator [Roseomonas fluvialis]CAH0176888.1 Transcriptional regulatory protein OmpR [Roseomonas sp. CECT 9278]